MPTDKPGWGGKRVHDGNKGGRPPKTSAQKAVDALKRLARKYAKRHDGKMPEEVLLDLIYGEGDFTKAAPTTRYQAVACYMKAVMPTQSEQNVNVTKSNTPTVYLPEQKEDPALHVPQAKDAEEKVAH